MDLIMVEDSAVDAELITDALKEAGLIVTVRRVEDEQGFSAALKKRLPDAILSDWTLPDFSGRSALAIAAGYCPDIPFIFVSGTISETSALEVLREGAIDYVFKHQMQQLGPALERALKEVRGQRALRESEHRLRTLLDSIPELIWLKNTDGVYQFCNTTFESLLGAKEADIVGKTDYDFFDSEMADIFCFHDRMAMVATTPRRNSEWVTFAVNGRRALLDTLKTPLFDTKGNIVGILATARDITEHYNLEQQLRHSQKMEAIGTLAGGIAHDFNNILNVIMGYSTLAIERMEEDNPSKELINEVLIAAERAVTLTRRLLVFSRKDIVDVKPVNVNEIILNLQKMLIQIARERIALEFHLADIPFIVQADTGQIEQVLINLVSNAKDAMEGVGELSISTGLEMLDDEFVASYEYGKSGRYALIKVTDSGSGMDAETQKSIFEPFFTTKDVGVGTGLGLAISYGIIKQHNGYITVESEPGQGSVFKIYLPLCEEAETPDIKIKAVGPVKGGKETVLLAEDDASLRQLAQTILESFGYSVIDAVDGEDAIAKFMESKDRISLVLLDMIMPKKSGKEVSEAIRKVSPLIKILHTSGYPLDSTSADDQIEHFDFIHKPYQPSDLLKMVREILDRDPPGVFEKETNP